MTIVAIMLAAAIASAGSPDRGTRPHHILTDASAAVPLLRRWAPPEQGMRTAAEVIGRARSVASVTPAAAAAVSASVVAARRSVEESDDAAGRAFAPPEHPFRAYRGVLPTPVSGTVSAGYGWRSRADGATVERQSGLSFQVAENAVVRAVAPGIVEAIRPLAGMGVVVVIDHGDQFHTVYARLAEAWTYEGAPIDRGDVVGEAIGGAGRERELYFEVRDQGVPVDPREWLR